MACLTASQLALSNWSELIEVSGTTVTYYPVVLVGYVTATQSRSPSESTGVSVAGIFGEEKVNAPDSTISYVTTFTISSGAYVGTPSPGDRLVHNGQSYRVVELRRIWFGSVLTNYILHLEQ